MAMRLARELWIRASAFLLSLLRRSFTTHASVPVADVERSLRFYEVLGFRQVKSSRNSEVTLLRNYRGDELNLVSGLRRSSAVERSEAAHVSFGVKRLAPVLARLRSRRLALETREDAMTRRLLLVDPDGNRVEFYEPLDRDSLGEERLFHVATEAELIEGLEEHYYLPPEKENRFVRARARSAFLALACERVAKEAEGVPLLIPMEEAELSIEAQVVDESDFDSPPRTTLSPYPHVNAPIPRTALTAVGVCEEENGSFSWPSRFVSLDTPGSPRSPISPGSFGTG